jgi:hypothetical protein
LNILLKTNNLTDFHRIKWRSFDVNHILINHYFTYIAISSTTSISVQINMRSIKFRGNLEVIARITIELIDFDSVVVNIESNVIWLTQVIIRRNNQSFINITWDIFSVIDLINYYLIYI